MVEKEESPAQRELKGQGFMSGIVEFASAHKIAMIGAAIGIAIVAYVLSRSKAASNAGSTSQAQTSTGAAGQQGQLGNAGYQDQGTAYALTQLGQQLNNLTAQVALGTPGPTGATGATGAPGAPGKTGGVNYPGLIKTWPSNVKQAFGTIFNIGSTRYEIGPGSHGDVWAVALAPNQKPLTLTQFNQVPIAPGKKVLLYGPATGGSSTGGSPSTPEKFPSPVGLLSSHTLAQNVNQFQGLLPNRTEQLYSSNRPTYMPRVHPYQLSAATPTGSIGGIGQMGASLKRQGMPRIEPKAD